MKTVPKHVAVIMDGNGRWAQAQGLPRSAGHRAGIKSVRRLVEGCRKFGIPYLTLFSFSTENWKRGADEVRSLMELFKEYLEAEIRNPELLKNGVRLRAIGDLERLPFPVRLVLNQVIDRTKNNTELNLILAVSYSGKDDIVQAVKKIAEGVKKGELAIDSINAEVIDRRLWTSDFPDPDLLIRTGGEKRISNFLLWQLAYAEMSVVDEFWPDFDESSFARCLEDFANRERRFGLVPGQDQ